MIELYQTNCTTVAEALASENWKDRLIGEYNFVRQKKERLYSKLIAYDSGCLNFKLTCDPKLLKAQLNAMSAYSYILSIRMEVEHINPNLKKANIKPEVNEEKDEEETNVFDQMIQSMENLVSSLQEEMEKEETKNTKEEKKLKFTSVTCPNPNCDVAMETSKPDDLNYCPSCGTKLVKDTKDA